MRIGEEGSAVSRVGGAFLVALGAVLLAGCGSGSGSKSSGPSAEQIINGNVKSAAKSAVAKYATERSGDAEARLAAVKAAWESTHPKEPPPAPPAGGMPAVTVPPAAPEIIKAEADLKLWRDVLDLLRTAAGPEQIFQIKENKVGDVGADGASSRLVVDPAPAYQDMLGKQMSFDLQWSKVTRRTYDSVVRKTVYRTYWELRDSFLVKTAEEPGKKTGKE